MQPCKEIKIDPLFFYAFFLLTLPAPQILLVPVPVVPHEPGLDLRDVESGSQRGEVACLWKRGEMRKPVIIPRESFSSRCRDLAVNCPPRFSSKQRQGAEASLSELPALVHTILLLNSAPFGCCQRCVPLQVAHADLRHRRAIVTFLRFFAGLPSPESGNNNASQRAQMS